MTIPIKEPEFEVDLRLPVTKDLIAFDFGLLLTRDSNEVQIYIDDDLRMALDALLRDYGQVILKVNFFSPDVVVIAPSQNDLQAP